MSEKLPDHLVDTDFMMMDVHRPMTNSEVENIHPAAKVDRSLEVVTPDTKRCPYCFGPMPCEHHAGVEQLDIATSHDMEVTNILATAHNANMSVVVIVGFDEDGKEYFASSCSDIAESVYHLTRGIHRANKIVDDIDVAGEDPRGPKQTA
jgi:altronate dehydratase